MNKNLILIALVSLLVGGFGGYQLAPDGNQPASLFGAITVPSQSTTTHGTALQSALLFQWESNVVDSLRNVRAPLAGLITSAQTYNLISVASSGNAYAGSLGANATSTPAFTVAGAALGDFCKVSLSTDTSTLPHTVDCRVTAASTTVITLVNHSTATINISTGTVHFWIYPSSTFAAPAALDVSTTTTPYSN